MERKPVLKAHRVARTKEGQSLNDSAGGKLHWGHIAESLVNVLNTRLD
jgi:hypothetical protein